MPTVLIFGPYRFFFYSEEGDEPAHIHVAEDNKAAKFWLHSAELARSRNFKGHELTAIRKLIIEHRENFLEAWHVHFSSI
jgi:hypothetical protein